MRLQPDDFYENVEDATLLRELERINETDNCMELSMLQKKHYLKQLQRTRNLIFWHDGSTVSNHSHLLMTVHSLYDKAIHLTDLEFQYLTMLIQKSGNPGI